MLEYENVNPRQDGAGKAPVEDYQSVISKSGLARVDSSECDEKRKFPIVSEVSTIGVNGTTVSYTRGPNMEAAHA